MKKKTFEMVNNALEQLIKDFEAKQEHEFEYAVNDNLLDILCFGDYFFNIYDIYIDLFLNIPKGVIFEWQDWCKENQETTINLESYWRMKNSIEWQQKVEGK